METTPRLSRCSGHVIPQFPLSVAGRSSPDKWLCWRRCSIGVFVWEEEGSETARERRAGEILFFFSLSKWLASWCSQEED